MGKRIKALVMKEFKVRARIAGTYSYEDPKCPSYWKGSGCYDVTVASWYNVDVTVFAETEERAREMVETYDYDSDRRNKYTTSSDEIEITSIDGKDVDNTDEESIEVEYLDSMEDHYCERD